MFHNENKNESAYNYWNFTTSRDWDDARNPDNFWYRDTTRVLAATVPYKIGYEQI